MTAKVTAKRTRLQQNRKPGAAPRAAGVLGVTAKASRGAWHERRITVPSNAAAGRVVTNRHSSSFAVG